jgi:hypothetical protein
MAADCIWWGLKGLSWLRLMRPKPNFFTNEFLYFGKAHVYSTRMAQDSTRTFIGIMAVIVLGSIYAFSFATVAAMSQPSAADRAADNEISQGANPTRSTTMGPVCWAAILESISEIGKRCIQEESPAFRAALDEDIARLDAKFLANGWTPDGLERFKVQMGERDRPVGELCSNKDALAFYQGLTKSLPAAIHETTNEMLARPGRPEWGACL